MLLEETEYNRVTKKYDTMQEKNQNSRLQNEKPKFNTLICAKKKMKTVAKIQPFLRLYISYYFMLTFSISLSLPFSRNEF